MKTEHAPKGRLEQQNEGCTLYNHTNAYYDLPLVTKNRLRELTNSIQQCSQCTDIRRSYMYEEKIAQADFEKG